LVARFVGGVVQKRPRTFSRRFERRDRNLAPNVKRRRFFQISISALKPSRKGSRALLNHTTDKPRDQTHASAPH
jgi:hypothetical protein